MRGLDKGGLDKGFYDSIRIYNFCYMVGLDISNKNNRLSNSKQQLSSLFIIF